ncbi:MAG: hypothetical protein IV097_22100 [Burkholderiaceae bacterium]|nr:hypothetical protein [Burkholderiaceae bacterium]
MSSAGSGEEDWPELVRATKTIVIVDVVESVRLMQAYESDVIDRWRRFVHEVRTQVLPAHQGRMVKSLGDGMLLEFENVITAVAAALDLQERVGAYNLAGEEAARIYLRVGVHRAEVMVDELDLYGSGVNLAARLASLARPGGIICSAEVRDELVDSVHAEVEDLGMCYLKHWPCAIRVFQIGAVIEPERRQEPHDDPLASLAVLPFQAREPRPDCLAAADMLADEVVRSLGQAAYLRVISRLSSAAAAYDRSIAGIARRLDVAYIVSGAMALEAGGRISLDIRIEHGPSNTVLDVRTFSARLVDVLQGQDDLVPQAVSLISRCVVSRELERAQGKPLPSLEAQSLLMSGIGLIHRSASADFLRAQELLEALSERASQRPHGHAWLAKWHAMRVVQGLSDNVEEDAARALDCARRALDADPLSPLAHTMAGLAYGFLAKDLPVAQAHYEAALKTNPNEAMAWLYTGTLRAWQGRGREALAAARKALSLAPLDPMRYYFESLAGFAALAAGETQTALDWCLASLRANRMHTATHRTLALAQWRLGQAAEARATVRELMRLEPGFSVTRYLRRFPGGATAMALDNARDLRAAGAPN